LSCCKKRSYGAVPSVSLKYLPNYLAEFVFKYNHRKVDDIFETSVKNRMNPITDKFKIF